MRTVILAGGEGTRLRPLTCDIPKPMARLCGRPILEYLFDGLLRAGIPSATLTLGYLPRVIESAYPNGYRGLSLDFIREETPLGTAGSVRGALGDCRDSAFVLSGDALCDYGFAEILRAHRLSGACVTIAAARVDDPREYGLLRTDGSGAVTGFIEKPGWSQATGGLANTGIYVLEPEALERIPADRPFDFAKDLFPLLLREGKKIHCHEAKGYWCDVGDIAAFLRASRDILNAQCTIQNLQLSAKNGIFGKRPEGDYTVKPPVYFGAEVRIGNGAVIGPYAVMEDGVSVGAGARVRGSILMKGAAAGERCRVTGSLMCRGSAARRGANLFEGSVLGAGASAGEDSRVEPGVRVWPGKRVEGGCHARDNLRYGSLRRDLFGDGGLEADGKLTPRFCAALGSAMATVPDCRRAATAHDGSPRAKALARALGGGLQYGGASVWDFGESFPAQAAYCGAFGGRGFTVFVRGDTLIAAGKGGLPLPRYTERAIEAAYERGEERSAPEEKIRDIADMSSLRAAYRRELRRQCTIQSSQFTISEGLNADEKPLAGICVSVEGTNPLPREILRETLHGLGCDIGNDKLVLRLNAGGERAGAWTKDTGNVPFEKLLAVCCLEEFRRGRSLALPSDVPFFLEALARDNNCTLTRYLLSPGDDGDAAARRAAQSTPWTRDGLFLAVRLLSIIKRGRVSLAELLAELPAVHVRQSFISAEPPRFDEIASDGFEPQEVPEGYSLRKRDSRLLIIPGKSGRHLRVLAEAGTMEAAAELSAEAERLISGTSSSYQSRIKP